MSLDSILETRDLLIKSQKLQDGKGALVSHVKYEANKNAKQQIKDLMLEIYNDVLLVKNPSTQLKAYDLLREKVKSL